VPATPGDEGNALRYSKIDDYVTSARQAIQEMHRQVGRRCRIDAQGILRCGLIVRLLVLPNDLAGMEDSLDFISSELGRDVAVSLMLQYYPAHHTESQDQYPLLMRGISAAEWLHAVKALDRLGMAEGWIQDHQEAAD
jgi:putative pyruvate formate lyase activating enzyme